MNQYKSQSFVKLTIRFGLLFLITVSIIKIVMAIFNTGSFDGMIALYFGEDTFFQFAKIQLGMSLLYGLFMAGYYKFIKK
jgi:hypothetical protein